ncbi:hypothetical protein V8F06_007630 [Rhypophila decipiens]
MELKKLALRLVGLGQSKDKKTAKDKGKEKEGDCTPISSIVHHAGLRRDQDNSDRQALITQREMVTSADNQFICLFFARLPLEIRRLIYREVWRGYLESSCRQIPMPMPRTSSSSVPVVSTAQPPVIAPSLFSTDLGLHIYTDGSGGTKLGHTLCRVHDAPPDQGDQNRLSIQPWMYQEGNHPPMWLWRAWVMRQHWNRHWKCQSALMKRWNPDTGSVTEVERSPFLSMFLTCKKMYWETIASCFENITPIFTSSKDAHRFFVLHPHPFASHIRTLELNFTDQNDHLFLQQIQHADLEGAENMNMIQDDTEGGSTGSEVIGEPGESSTATTPISHQCSTPRCCLNLFGQQLLDQILDGIQAQIPSLKDLALTITGRMDHGPILDRFAYSPEEEAAPGQEDEAMETASEELNIYAAVTTSHKKWELPGDVNIKFEAEGLRYLIHKGGKLICKRMDSI